MKLMTVLVSIVAIFWLIPSVQIAATFDPERLRLLDQTDTSLLVRGNVPLNSQGRFDPSLVLNNIQSRLVPHRNLTRYRIVVVSLLSNSQSDEKAVLEAEKEFWSEPQERDSRHYILPGELLHRPVVGSWLAPPPVSNLPRVTRTVWNLWQPDDGAWDLAGELRQQLLMQKDSAAIYFHCMRGMDRTGLVAGSYMAQFLNATEDEVHHANYDVARRELNWPARNSLKWINWRSSRGAALCVDGIYTFHY